jgi:hypothetical protein
VFFALPVRHLEFLITNRMGFEGHHSVKIARRSRFSENAESNGSKNDAQSGFRQNESAAVSVFYTMS